MPRKLDVELDPDKIRKSVVEDSTEPDALAIQRIKNDYGDRIRISNKDLNITEVDGVPLSEPISLVSGDVEDKILSNLKPDTVGDKLSNKDPKESENIPIDRKNFSNVLAGKGRKLVLAPSGTGKSFLVSKYGKPFVDLDTIIDWPDSTRFPKWWENPPLSELVHEQLKERFKHWLDQPGEEIGLYADSLDGFLKPDAVVTIDRSTLLEHLMSRDEEKGKGVQPGKDDLDRLMKGMDELANEFPNRVFNGFDELLGFKGNTQEQDQKRKTETNDMEEKESNLDEDKDDQSSNQKIVQSRDMGVSRRSGEAGRCMKCMGNKKAKQCNC